MKTKIYVKALVLLAMVSLSAYDLDVEDKTALTPELALTDVAAFDNMLVAAYARVNDFDFYGRDTQLQGDILADNFYIRNLSGRYQGEELNLEGAHFNRWGVYTMINDCNIVLDRIDDPAVTGDQALKDQYKGEAYFLRALAYHELLRSYSYEPGREVDGFELGVVHRTEGIVGFAGVTNLPRSTVAQGYALLEDDLTKAINLLPAQGAANVHKYRARKAAAQALLARVLLYAGKYPEAAVAADAALAGTTAVLTDSAGYVASFSATPHPESIFESELTAADWSTVDGANNSLHSYTQNHVNAGGFFTLSPSAQFEALLAEEPLDVRNNIIITSPQELGDGSGFPRILLKWNGEKGAFLENVPVIRYSEVLLTAAEAKARSGDPAGAQADITTFRANRVPSAAPVTATGNALIDIIMRERRLELIGEGHRYYDLKRLGLPITKATESKAKGAEDLPYSNYKVLGRIPVSEIRISEQILEQNPGY